MDAFISTVPFGEIDPAPIKILEEHNISYLINPLGRKLRKGEISEFIRNSKVIIAGTELITRDDIKSAKNLRLISRVGIGLDNVDLSAAMEYGVAVSYTPDAPSPAVAELTVGLMLDISRSITLADRKLRENQWKRIIGNRLSNLTIGIIGVGRIGFRVIQLLSSFRCKILASDVAPIPQVGDELGVKWCTKDELLSESDIVSVHVPLTHSTRDLISYDEFSLMKSSASIVNTARGGIVNENALFEALKNGEILSAAIDVFEEEPYSGPLTKMSNVILTQHMGSCTRDCRVQMEKQAAEETARFLVGKPLRGSVPQAEYNIQKKIRES